MLNDEMIGKNIRFFRNAAKYSLKDLSIQIDIRYDYLSSVELGKKTPSVKLLINLANFFGIPLSELIKDTSIPVTSCSDMEIEIYSLLSTFNDSDLEYLYSLARNICDF